MAEVYTDSESLQAYLYEYITEYCYDNGLDPDTYLENLDGNYTSAVIDIPELEVYFQWAFIQLMQIVDPDALYSDEGEVLSFEEVYNNADSEFVDLIIEMIQDDPELLAFFAMQAEGETGADYVMSILQDTYDASESSSDSDSDTSDYNEEARELIDEYGLDSLTWLADFEDAAYACEMYILDELAELDAYIYEIAAMYESGDLTLEQYDAELGNVSYWREFLLSLMQEASQVVSTVFEMYSDLWETLLDTQERIIDRI